jgi:hypothetical protein
MADETSQQPQPPPADRTVSPQELRHLAETCERLANWLRQMTAAGPSFTAMRHAVRILSLLDSHPLVGSARNGQLLDDLDEITALREALGRVGLEMNLVWRPYMDGDGEAVRDGHVFASAGPFTSNSNPALADAATSLEAATRVVEAAADRMDAAARTNPPPADERPPAPTAAFCLLNGFRVRWNGETTVRRQLWRVLEFLLSRGENPCGVRDLEDAVWNGDAVLSKTLANTLSELNGDLCRISFPWTWHVGQGQIHREG